MNRKDIKILFLIKDSNPSKIAKKLKIKHQAIYRVMAGHIKSRRIAAELERVLELPLAEIQKAYRTQYIPSKHGQCHDSVGSLLDYSLLTKRPPKPAIQVETSEKINRYKN